MKKRAELESLKCDHEPALMQLEAMLKSKNSMIFRLSISSKGQRVLELTLAAASIIGSERQGDTHISS